MVTTSFNATQITPPRVPIIDDRTGLVAREWYRYFYSLYAFTGGGTGILPIASGGTGLDTIPTDGQLLIGDTASSGYKLHVIDTGAGIAITNGAGTILITNTGVLSNIAGSGIGVSSATGNVTVSNTGVLSVIAGSGISVSSATGNVTLANTGVLSFSGGSTGLLPSTATTGAVSLSGTLGVDYGGTGQTTYTNGQLLIGNTTGNTLTKTTLTAGSGVSISNGAGSITISATGSGGTVTAVTGTAPVVSSGGTTPAISMPAATTSVSGYLTSTDWNTFNGKQPAGTYVTSITVTSSNGLAGTVTSGATPAITLSTSITGILKGNGTAISAATSGTDYAPATSGSSILYGNGAGGFSNVTIGTGVSFAGGTLSATGSGGTVTSVTGTAPVVSSGGATPAISMAAATASVNGYLTSTDWTTFNNKGSGSVTSVGGTGTVNGITLTGTVTTTGNLTLGGTLSGVSLTTQVSGTLPVGNGGTGLTTLTAGYIPYGNGTSAFSSSSSLFFDGTNLGIGTSSPSVKLEVAGSAKLTNGNLSVVPSTATNSAYLLFTNTGGNFFSGIDSSTGASFTGVAYGRFLYSGGAYPMIFITNDTERMRIASNGIITMSAYGAGAATFSASGVISSVSDETWKIKDGLPVNPDEMLKKLEPGYWYYNDEKKDTFGKDRQLGFYAQNVNAAIGPEAAPEPETYTTKDENGVETTHTKPWGYYDRSVLAVTVMSLQKALNTIEELNAKFNAYVESHP